MGIVICFFRELSWIKVLIITDKKAIGIVGIDNNGLIVDVSG